MGFDAAERPIRMGKPSVLKAVVCEVAILVSHFPIHYITSQQFENCA